MLSLRRLTRIGIGLCLRDWQGSAVVIVVEVQARLEDGKHVKDASKVDRSFIESFAFPRSAYPSATSLGSTWAEPCLLSCSNPAQIR